MFIRYDPLARAQDPRPRPEEEGRPGREFLFFGDVESKYRAKGEEGYREEQGKQAGMMNRAIWEEAAKSAQAGRLAGIFVSPCTSSIVGDVS